MKYFQILVQLCKTNFVNIYGFGSVAIFKILLKPLFVLFVFTIVFDKFIKIETGVIPYPIFAFSGLIIWEAFFLSFVSALNFYDKNSNILKNFNLPILLVQTVEMTNIYIETIFKIIVFNVICLFFGDFNIIQNLFLFSLYSILPIFIGFGFGLWFVFFDLKRRLVINNLPYFFGYLMWLTPVFFPENIIPQKLLFLVYFNPISEIIFFLRHSILSFSIETNYTGVSLLLSVFVSLFGYIILIKSKYKLIEII